MKVKELIELLQKFDSEEIVVVDGYETGYDETGRDQSGTRIRCGLCFREGYTAGEKKAGDSRAV